MAIVSGILPSSSLSFSSLSSHSHNKKTTTTTRTTTKPYFSHRLRCSSSSSDEEEVDGKKKKTKTKKLSDQSSWESKDVQGKDYLYRLGQESDNMNIAVGARNGVIDDLFVGEFLGKNSDIVFDYRQKATRSFEYLQGDYYIAPVFLDKIGKLHRTLLEV